MDNNDSDNDIKWIVLKIDIVKKSFIVYRIKKYQDIK